MQRARGLLRDPTWIIYVIELKILTMLCSGLEREAIAKELNITTGTLKNHISSILNKMEFDSITKLLVYCVKNGYIIPSDEQ